MLDDYVHGEANKVAVIAATIFGWAVIAAAVFALAKMAFTIIAI